MLCSNIMAADWMTSTVSSETKNGEEEVNNSYFVEPHPTSNFKCHFPGCNKIIRHKKHYKDHYRTHTGEKPYSCNECGKCFQRPYHLKRHKAIHSTDLSFNCEYENCSYKCKFPANLKKHIRRIHEVDKPFKCSVDNCSESFKKHNEKTIHEALHKGENPFKCEVDGCGRCYPTNKSLKEHMKVHKKEKGYPCKNDKCGAVFYTWSDLQKHKFACKVLKCESCGKIFKAVWQLNKHKVIHDENRVMYKCPVEGCDREYTTESNVVAHISACHQEEKTFVCPEENCGQSFAHKCSLKRHLANHERIIEMYKRIAKNKKKKEKKRRKQTRVISSTLSKVTGIIPELHGLVSDSDCKDTSDYEAKGGNVKTVEENGLSGENLGESAERNT